MKIKRLSTLFALVCASLFLSACDGGISGSGAEIIVDSGVPSSDLQPCESTPCGEVDPEQSGNTAEAADPLDTSFTNTLDVLLQNDDARVNVVHALSGTNDALVVTNAGDTSAPTIGLPGLSFEEGHSGFFSLGADTHNIDIIRASEFTDDTNAEKIAGVNPLTLASGSVSTLIVRGSEELPDAPVEAFVLENKVGADDAGNILFRVVIAAAHFGAEGNVDIYITEENEPLTAGSAQITNLSYTTGSPGYILLMKETYTITITDTDSLFQRVVIGPLSPTGGSATTFIIRDSRAPDALLGVDTDIVTINDGNTSGL